MLIKLVTLAAGVITLPGFAVAQERSVVQMQQVPSRTSAQSVQSAPVGGTGSSSSAQERFAAPVVPPEIIEACRAAQAGDRPPPDGIDCMAAMQALAAAQAPSNAETTLLDLFGMRSNVTSTSTVQPVDSSNADAAARQLATGDVQTGTSSGAAAIVARDRGAPPPSALPGGGPR